MHGISLIRAIAAVAMIVPLPAVAQGYGAAPAGSYNWSGWYLGANAGYAWRSENPYPSNDYYSSLGVIGYGSGGATNSTSGSSTYDGFTAGATLGYQYQFGSLVLGADYDLQYADIANSPRLATTTFAKQTGTTTSSPGTVDPYTGVSSSSGSTPVYSTYTAGNYDPTDGDVNRWTGIARLRAGLAFDRFLVFATGGAAYRFAYGSYDPYVVQPNGSVTTYSGYNKANAWGYVIGGGVEYGISDTITAKFDYLHMDFGTATYVDPIASTALGKVVTYNYDKQVDMVRVGVNFRFNFGPGGKY